MKIGIFTYHHAYSYGAKLQAYALATYLRQLGHNAEDVDYGNIGGQPLRKIGTKSIKDFIVTTLCYICSTFSEPVRIRRFDDFLKLIPKSNKRYLTKESLKGIEEEYDCFITGSDQVWCPRYNEGDTTYLLDFIQNPDKKYSYAASFGVSELEQPEATLYGKLLTDFNKILIREEAGKNLLHKLNGKEAQVVLDPTFLLETEKWENLAHYPYKRKFPYILSFQILANDPAYAKFVEHLAQITGYKVIVLSDSFRYKPVRGILYAKAGPREFLGLIKNAEVVVTNSYHATVFSLIFQRPFYTLLNSFGLNSRMQELADKFGFKERLFDAYTPLPRKEEIKMDFNTIQPLIASGIHHSRNIIIETFGCTTKQF